MEGHIYRIMFWSHWTCPDCVTECNEQQFTLRSGFEVCARVLVFLCLQMAENFNRKRSCFIHWENHNRLPKDSMKFTFRKLNEHKANMWSRKNGFLFASQLYANIHNFENDKVAETEDHILGEFRRDDSGHTNHSDWAGGRGLHSLVVLSLNFSLWEGEIDHKVHLLARLTKVNRECFCKP